MAALALDDLMDKKKEPPPILDLSQSIVNSKEELDQLLARVPEYKIRPEKVLYCLKANLKFNNDVWILSGKAG